MVRLAEVEGNEIVNVAVVDVDAREGYVAARLAAGATLIPEADAIALGFVRAVEPAAPPDPMARLAALERKVAELEARAPVVTR